MKTSFEPALILAIFGGAGCRGAGVSELANRRHGLYTIEGMLLVDQGTHAMIVPALPPELGEFVEQQIATGRYRSEEDLVVDAVRVLSRLAARQHEFHDAVRQGREQLRG